jgi:hypothetical protein
MITNSNEFADESEWEETVLAVTVPLTPLASVGTNFDLRTKNVTRSMTGVSTGQAAVEELRNRLLPLCFGAAWKILDLAFELALATGGLSPQNGRRWRIDEKVTLARSHNGNLPAIPLSGDIWTALTSLYAETSEMRNALVHRKVQVDPETRELIGFDVEGAKLRSLTCDEQLAFCRVSQRLRQAITARNLEPRVAADLAGQLTTLGRHHGVKTFPEAATSPPVRIADSFPEHGKIDVPALLAEAEKTFPGTKYVDLELRLADGRVLAGRILPRQAWKPSTLRLHLLGFDSSDATRAGA